MPNQKNNKVDELKYDLEKYTNNIKKKQREEDFFEFHGLVVGMLYLLEDKEGNANRKDYDNDFWKGARKILYDLILDLNKLEKNG